MDDMLRMLGIELELGWITFVLVGIGIALIIYGAIPKRVKDWSKEQVQLIFPDRVVTPKQLERELKWHRILGIPKAMWSVILKIISKLKQ